MKKKSCSTNAKVEIVISKHAGYCGGVKRTLTIVDELLKNYPHKKIYMLGEIVHNEYVLNRLKEKGIRIIYDFQKAKDGLLVIQSHGISENLFKEIRNSGIEYVDTTCPMVKNIHNRIKQLEQQGYFPVIIGGKQHEEVKGITGQVKQAIIIKDPKEVTKKLFHNINKAGIVVQSTFIKEEALKIMNKIKEFVKEVKFENTICKPTTDRQNDAYINVKNFDCVFVFGSKTSANTNNLYHIAKSQNPNTFFVSSPGDIPKIDFMPCNRIYIISGASTPYELIDEIVNEIKLKLKI